MSWLRVWLLVCGLVLSGGATSFATTYYVATTGNDTTGVGSAGNPWATPQKCVDSMAAGDTCTVGDGTYTDTDGNGIVAYIRSGINPNCTAGAPCTLKSTNPRGAILQIPSVANTGNRSVRLGRAYWIIKDFDIQGGTSSVGTNLAYTGIYLGSGSDGAIIQNNWIHGVASTVCSASTLGFAGIFAEIAADHIIENNLIHTIGRLRDTGESGCVTGPPGGLNHHDHAIYIKGTTRTTIRRNVIYDANRGYAIHVFGGTSSTLNIYNNTIAGKSPTGYPNAQVRLASTINTANIKNNVSYDPDAAFIDPTSLTATGITITKNLSDSADADMCLPTCTISGVTSSANVVNTSPGFVNAAGNDFRLATGSAAIDAGVDVGLPANGTPDIGAYETFTATSGTCLGNVATLQMDMALNTPFIPGTTGYSVTVDVGGGDVARTVTGVALSGSSAAAITFNGAALAVGNVCKASYTTASGTASDSALVGGTLNQRLNSLGPITLTNLAAGASYTLTQTAGAFYSALGAQTTTAPIFHVSPGGAVAVRTKFKATGGYPPAITSKLQCAVNGENGDYADLPDTFGAGDCPNIRYIGLVGFPGADTHGTTTTERLTSEFTGLVAGGVIRCLTGCEVPAVNLDQDAESEQVDLVEFDNDTPIDTVYHFRRVLSDGTAMTYAANSTPSITISAPSASTFAQAKQPWGLTATPNPTQAGQPFAGLPELAMLSSWSPCWLAGSGSKWDGRLIPGWTCR